DRGAGGHPGRRARRRAAPATRAPTLRPVSGRRGRAAGDRLTQSRRSIGLPIRRLREEAVLPARAYEGDAGLDLAACGRVVLAPGERALVPTGLAVAIPEGYAGFVHPRSG